MRGCACVCVCVCACAIDGCGSRMIPPLRASLLGSFHDDPAPLVRRVRPRPRWGLRRPRNPRTPRWRCRAGRRPRPPRSGDSGRGSHEVRPLHGGRQRAVARRRWQRRHRRPVWHHWWLLAMVRGAPGAAAGTVGAGCGGVVQLRREVLPRLGRHLDLPLAHRLLEELLVLRAHDRQRRARHAEAVQRADANVDHRAVDVPTRAWQANRGDDRRPRRGRHAGMGYGGRDGGANSSRTRGVC